MFSFVRIAPVGAVMLVLGCAPKPAALELSEALPARVLSTKPVPAPKVVVKDAKGQPLAVQPATVLAADRPDLLVLRDGQLVAVGTGQAQLVATLADPPLRLAVPVEVALIDRTQIECEPSCDVKLGDVVHAVVSSYAGKLKIEGACQPTLSGSAFSNLSGDRYQANSAGTATVRCGAGSVELRARPPIDALTIGCPTATAHASEPAKPGKKGAPPEPKPCAIEQGTTHTLKADGRAQGALVGGLTVAWRSSDPLVARVNDGHLVALEPGKITVSATIDGQSAELAVEVTPSVNITCTGGGRRFRFTYMEPTEEGNISATIACESARSEACVDAKLDDDPSLEEVERVLALCCCDFER